MRVYEHLPLLTMDERSGRPNQWWQDDLQHTHFDAYWDAISYQNRFDQVDVPVLHITGWYDDEQIGTPMNYVGMTANGRTEQARANQKLLIGPWEHRINTASKLGEVAFGPTAIIALPGY